MNDDLEQATVRCAVSRRAFLECARSFGEEGPELRSAMIEHAQRYIDDPERGRTVRDYAGRVESELRRFGSVEANLISRLAIRSLESNVRVNSEFADQLGQIFSDISAGHEPHKSGASRNAVEAIDTLARAELAILTQLFDTATALISLHRSTIESYVGKHVGVGSRSILSAIKQRLNDEGEDAAIEMAGQIALEIGAELLWLVKIFERWRKFKKTMEQLEYRGAGPEDSLLDLVEDLKNINDQIQNCSDSI